MDSTGHDDLAALDFSAVADAEHTDYGDDDADVFDFSAPDDHDDSADNVLDEYEPAEPEGTGTELDALSGDDDDAAEDDDEALEPYTSTVTNPAGTVSVSALIDGSIRQVELSPKATELTEPQLAEEILVLAHLAQQKGLASQHTYLSENEALLDGMSELGLDGREVVRDFMQLGMGLPTPAQAEAEQAEVFAARYAGNDD